MTDEWRIREQLAYILESSCTPEEAYAQYPELLTHVCNRLEQVRQVEDQLDLLFRLLTEVEENKRDITFSAGETADHALYLRLFDTEDSLSRSKLGSYSVHSNEVHSERLIK